MNHAKCDDTMVILTDVDMYILSIYIVTYVSLHYLGFIPTR